MSSSGTSNSQTANDGDVPEKPPSSNDIGWNYGKLVKPNNYGLVECKLCNVRCYGGIFRLKQHIAGITGDVRRCTKAKEEDRAICKSSLEEATRKKKEKKMAENARRAEAIGSNLEDGIHDDATIFSGSGLKRTHESGQNKLEDMMRSSGKLRQTVINEVEQKRERENAHFQIAMWAYEAGVPFHAFSLPRFDSVCEAIGKYGQGYKGPNQQLRVSLLKKCKDHLNEGVLSKQKEAWKKFECSIMTDAWTDRKRRSVMNLCVHGSEGTTFLESIEDSESTHTGPYIFNWVEECIKKVGAEYVVQIVTDNHSSNMMAKDMMLTCRPNIFWTSCSAHTLDLMLEGIGKARNFTTFLYAHQTTLALMRKYTKRRDLVRPRITRFATAFLSLNCLLEKKEQLAALCMSDDWDLNKHTRTEKEKVAKATILSTAFWRDARQLVKIYVPLFKLLRIVDADKRPSMGFVYGMLEDAKKEITVACNNNESLYRPILDIIEEKGSGRLNSSLHLAAYYLNPYYFYRDDVAQNNNAAKSALTHCVEKFYLDEDIQYNIARNELPKYKKAEGDMGKVVATKYWKKFDDTFNPADWWDSYGVDVPNLQSMTIKILNLTSSSSGCERNWSTFEGIHTKKRNRLTSDRLNDLVFVQFNSKLANKRDGTDRRGNPRAEVLLAPGKDDSRALHWKNDRVVEIENEDDEETFPGSGLTWRQVAEASGANEVLENRRSLRTYSRRGKRPSSSMVDGIDDVEEEDEFPRKEDGDEELHTDGIDELEEEEEVEDLNHYEDDDEW